MPSTHRVLIGASYLSLLHFATQCLAMPLAVQLDFLEEAGWLSEVERREAERLAFLVAQSVIHQRAEMGNLGLYWPRLGFPRVGIEAAEPVLSQEVWSQ